jgi:hypothetical protein
MKYLTLLLFWVIPFLGKAHCIESFPIYENFEDVSVTLYDEQIQDVYDICVSSAGNGKNTLNISRKEHSTISIYHDRITKLVYYVWSKKFVMITNCGVCATFKTKNLETRDRIRSYFPGIPIDFCW